MVDWCFLRESFLNFNYSTSAFTINVKSYNQFVSIDTYELKALAVIQFVAQVNTILDKINIFDHYYLIKFNEMVWTRCPQNG